MDETERKTELIDEVIQLVDENIDLTKVWKNIVNFFTVDFFLRILARQAFKKRNRKILR